MLYEINEKKQECVNMSQHGIYKLYLNTQVEDYPDHWHTPIEIIMPVTNGYRAHCNQTDYRLREGDILIIGSGVLHNLQSPPDGCRLIFQIDFSAINGFTDPLLTQSTFTSVQLLTPEDTPDIYTQAQSIFRQILREAETNLPLSSMKVLSLITDFFVLLGRKNLNDNPLFDNEGKNNKTYTDTFISINEYITTHCTENLTLEDVAAKAGFSKYHFSRLFKQFTNMGFTQFLNAKRIAYAEKLLTDPELSITEISYLSGFNSSSAFVRVFKSVRSYTPSEYRKLHDR